MIKNKHRLIMEHFFRPRWYSIFINPYFIDRYTLYQKIKNFSQNIGPNLKILDVGCGHKPYSHLFAKNNYIGIEIDDGNRNLTGKDPDKFYDGETIPYKDQEFDLIICTQVLEHTLHPANLIKEMYRVLRDGGQIFVTAPLISQEHEQPYDFWRFTQFAHQKLFTEANFIDIEIYPTCNFFSSLGQLTSSFIFESVRIRNTWLKLIITVFILAPIQTISLGLDKIFPNKRITLNYIVIAKK